MASDIGASGECAKKVVQSRARGWLFDAFESLPSIVFIALLRLGADLETAGWIGAALAAAVLVGLPACRMRYNPILLGINVHLLLVTPIIVGAFRLGASDFGEMLTRYSYQGVLLTIFLVSLVLALCSDRGFANMKGSPSLVRQQSLVMLFASLGACVWSFTLGGNTTIGVALPIIGLFVLRHVMNSAGARHERER